MDKISSHLSVSTPNSSNETEAFNRSVISDSCPDTSSYMDNSSSYENDDFVITKGPWTAEVNVLFDGICNTVSRKTQN